MQQFAVRCGCGRTMNQYGRAGRNAFRCGCGSRVQVLETPVTTRVCTFGDCRILATTKEPLRFCPEHEEQAASLLAHTAGAVKVRELEMGLTQTEATWTRKYGYRIHAVPQNKQHAPVVYFARRERLIKIGTTTHLARRMTSLHAEALATQPGDLVLERHLHRRFKHLRAPGRSREWFYPEPDLLEYVNDLRAASGIPPLGSPTLPIGQCVELEDYLAESTECHAGRTLTQEGEVLAGHMTMVRFARSNSRSHVHAAVTGTSPTRRTAVAACAQSKELGSDTGGLIVGSMAPEESRCRRGPCRARWATLYA